MLKINKLGVGHGPWTHFGLALLVPQWQMLSLLILQQNHLDQEGILAHGPQRQLLAKAFGRKLDMLK